MKDTFQSHQSIISNLDLEVLKPEVHMDSTAAMFLASIFTNSADFANALPPSPYLTCPCNHRLAWLAELPAHERRSPENTVVDHLTYFCGKTKYRLDFFEDRSALLSCEKEGDSVRQYVPWPFYLAERFGEFPSRVGLEVNPANKGLSCIELFPRHDDIDKAGHAKIARQLSIALREDARTIAAAFQDAAPLLRDFSGPAWLEQQHLAVAPFARFSTMSEDHKENIRQLLNKLARYIFSVTPDLFMMEIECIAGLVGNNGSLQPAHMKFGRKTHLRLKISAFENWFNQYMNHPLCIVPKPFQFVQPLMGRTEIINLYFSENMATSAHARMSAYADMQPFFDVLPPPGGQTALAI